MSEAPGSGHDSLAGDDQQPESSGAAPDGDPYSWYRRGLELLGRYLRRIDLGARLRQACVGLRSDYGSHRIILVLLGSGLLVSASVLGTVVGLLLLTVALRVSRRLGALHRRLASWLLG